MSTTIIEKYGTYTSLNVVNLSSLGNSQTVGWKSDLIDNTGLLALDYEINFKFPMANTAPANDKSIYIFGVPWMWDGSLWHPGGDLGTTTAITAGDAGATIAIPPNLRPLAQFLYTTQNMTLSGQLTLCPTLGSHCPDGWSLVVINFSGAALGASPVIAYRPLNYSEV